MQIQSIDIDLSQKFEGPFEKPPTMEARVKVDLLLDTSRESIDINKVMRLFNAPKLNILQRAAVKVFRIDMTGGL